MSAESRAKYQCACVSDSARDCASLRWYSHVAEEDRDESDDRCECECHKIYEDDE